MNKFHVALIETAGNQAYIFQSNKLREAVGGSELIRLVGEEWTGKTLNALRDENRLSGEVFIVVATSGKAVLLVEARKDAEEIIWEVTHKALAEAPGLGVFGAVSEDMLDEDSPVEKAHTVMQGLFRKIETNRTQLSPIQARFPFQPMVQPCRTSGLPAESFLTTPEGRKQPISAAAEIKRSAGIRLAKARLDKVFEQDPVCGDGEALEDMGLTWWAVVHADGNGFGEEFLNLGQRAIDGGRKGARAYFEFYGEVSDALDRIGKDATKAAVHEMKTRKRTRAELGEKHATAEPGSRSDRTPERRPIVPLVMGGDDLTVVCDGTQAIQFARDYVSAFEHLVDNDPVIKALGTFGAAAGVAIVKPHHPFHRAYKLADELTQSAKQSKPRLGRGVSALDFQVVFGDTTSDLDTLRGQWLVDSGRSSSTEPSFDSLTARPYVLSEENRFASAREDGKSWAARRMFDGLERAKCQLIKPAKNADGEERPAFPRSQQHVLRDSLFDGMDAADNRLRLIHHRYSEVEFGAFGEELPQTSTAADKTECSLFFSDKHKRQDIQIEHSTRLLDAMDLVDVEKSARDAEVSSEETPGVAA